MSTLLTKYPLYWTCFIRKYYSQVEQNSKYNYILVKISTWLKGQVISHGPLTRYVKLRVAHAPGMPGTFFPEADFKGHRWLAITACITARASRTCRDACRDRIPAVAGKTLPAFPAHAHLQFYVSDKRPMDQEVQPLKCPLFGLALVRVLACHMLCNNTRSNASACQAAKKVRRKDTFPGIKAFLAEIPWRKISLCWLVQTTTAPSTPHLWKNNYFLYFKDWFQKKINR